MGAVSLPFNIQGTDTKDISQVMANLQAIVDEVNGSLVASTNVAVAAAVTQDGNANAAGSSSSLARADHTHLIRGVERRAADPTTGNSVGRVYFNTATGKVRICTDATGSGTFKDVPLATGAEGSLSYIDGGLAAWTNGPTDAQELRAVGDVPTWKTRERVRARMSAAQQLPNNTATAIPFAGTDDFDTDTMHDPASNNTRITFTTAGVYAVLAGGPFFANSTALRRLFVRLNGTTDIGDHQIQATASGSPFLQVQAFDVFAAADYVELMAFQNSGGNLDFGGTGRETFFAAWRVG